MIRFLLLLALLASSTSAQGGPPPPPIPPVPHTRVVVFGDTQWWADSDNPSYIRFLHNPPNNPYAPGIFPRNDGAMDWIADPLNQISYVVFVGDMVSHGQYTGSNPPPNGNPSDWDLFRFGVSPILPGTANPIKWNSCTGNHDFDFGANYASSGPRIDRKNWTNWDSQGYGVRPSMNTGPNFRGGRSSEFDIIQMENQDIGFIYLDWNPHDYSLEWAAAIMELFPNLPIIMVIHSWWGGSGYGAERPNEPVRVGDNNTVNARRKFVHMYPQILGFLAGHGPISLAAGNWFQRTTTPLHGRKQFELTTNTNSDPFGGYGYFILMEMDITNDQIRTRMMTAYKGGIAPQWRRDEARTIILDLSAQFTYLNSKNFYWLRGVDPLTGTTYAGGPLSTDTYIDQRAPTSVKNNQITVVVTHSNISRTRHGLLKFDLSGVVGTVDKAILTFHGGIADQLTTPLDISAYVMHPDVSNGNWDNNATWNSRGSVGGNWGGNGVTPGAECAATADFVLGAANSQEKTTWSFDVTTTVNAWLTGTDNNGWAFIQQAHSGTDDSWLFNSTEFGVSTSPPGSFVDAPTLFIVTTPP